MNHAKGFHRLSAHRLRKISMPRKKKILFALCLLILLGWMGSAVEYSSAQPQGHAHKHIFSQPNEHEHSAENAVPGKFYCPMHKHRSLMPCPHKHSQKEMADPRQCKIGPDCGGSPVQSLPLNFSFDTNLALLTDRSRSNLPNIAPAVRLLPVAYDDPPRGSKKHPPRSL